MDIEIIRYKHQTKQTEKIAKIIAILNPSLINNLPLHYKDSRISCQ